MRILAAFAAAAVSLLLAGCYVQSVHPLYTEDKLTFDPGLVGTWADAEEPGEHTLTLGVAKGLTKLYDDDERPVIVTVRASRMF